MKLKHPSSSKVYHKVSDIFSLVQSWKNARECIVFTNGCFDILHIGHVDYLEKASCKGDRMIVGLNADNSVKRLKGENRPINSQDNRAKLLASMEFVDAVVIFEEDTPMNLIQSISPDVLIKGSDYSVENIIGSQHVIKHGGKVETIDITHTISTSDIIRKIQADK